MKKKRFYNNKKRNQKWTEPVTGRKIYFADKYVGSDNGTNKFTPPKSKTKKPFFTKDRLSLLAQRAVALVCSLALIFAGYTAMDLYMQRNSMPVRDNDNALQGGVGNVQVSVKGCRVESLALDAGVMLKSVINDAVDGGYTSIAFDAKRDDGTIGYESSLATVDAYGAESSQATDAPSSVKRLTENNIMPVAVVACYKDNIYSRADANSAVTVNGKLYEDKNGCAYLNPDSKEAYVYIKSIIEELKAIGISVFVLTECDLPREISSDYNDGFDALSDRLYADIGNDIKLVYGQSVQVNSDSVKDIEKETAEKISSKNELNKVFCVTAKDAEKTKIVLDSTDKINYVIAR